MLFFRIGFNFSSPSRARLSWSVKLKKRRSVKLMDGDTLIKKELSSKKF